MTTTLEKPLPMKADRVRLHGMLRELFNELEQLTWRMPDVDEFEGCTELGARRVDAEQVAELAAIIGDLEIEVDEFGRMLGELRMGLRYLLEMYEEQSAHRDHG